jgi:hypothetical protein
LGQRGAELIGHLLPDLAGRVLVGLRERLAERGGAHAVLALGHVGERVPHPVERQRCHAAPSTFAIAGLRPFMGVRDHQRDAPEAAEQALEEGRLERLRLGGAEAQADELALALGVHSHRDLSRPRRRSDRPP